MTNPDDYEASPRVSGSLNKHIKWDSAWDLLHTPDRLVGLPANLPCPLCREGSMGADRDAAWGGAWFHCRACGFAGDSIELHAAATGIDVREAANALRDHRWPSTGEVDFDAAADEHRRVVVSRRKQMTSDFDEFISAAFIGTSSENLGKLRDQLGFRGGVGSIDAWKQRGGAYIGAVDRAAIGTLLAGGNRQTGKRLARDGWSEFLTAPAHDLPGRLCGFFDLGCRGDLAGVRFRHVLDTFGGSAIANGVATYIETGVAMLPTTLAGPHPEFGDTVFAIGDVVTALGLQLRNLAERPAPLPLLGWTPIGRRRPVQAFNAVRDRATIIWCPDVVEALRVGRMTDGLVATRPEAAAMLTDHANEPAAVLRWLRESAEPWRTVLFRRLSEIPAREADALFDVLAATRDELASLEVDAVGVARDRLRARLATQPRRFCVPTSVAPVIEVDGRWRSTSTRFRAEYSNFLFRVDRVVRFRNGRPNRYETTLHCDGRDHPIVFNGTTWRHGLVQKLQAEAKKAGVIPPLRFWDGHGVPGRVGTSPLELGTLFHPPEIVDEDDIVGWSQPSSSFVFPTFRILLGGAVRPIPVDLRDDPQCPFRDLDEFRPLDPAEVAALSERTPGVRALWSVAVHAIARFVQPALGSKPGPAAFAAVDPCGAIAAIRACGASPARSTIPGRRHGLPQYRIGWLNRHVLESSFPSGVLVMPRLPIALRGLIWRPWDTTFTPTAQAADVPVAPLIPAYVQDLAARRLSLPPGRSHGARVSADLAAWFERIGGDPSLIRDVERATARVEDREERLPGLYLAALAADPTGPVARRGGEMEVTAQSLLAYLVTPLHASQMLARSGQLFRAVGAVEYDGDGGDLSRATWRWSRDRFEAEVARLGPEE